MKQTTQAAPEWGFIGMTLEETAAALRVAPRTIQTLIRRGDFPARKVGVGWRISPAAVLAWLEKRDRQASETETAGHTERGKEAGAARGISTAGPLNHITLEQ